MKTLLRLESKALGDTIGASPYFEEYRKKTGEDVYVSCHFKDYFEGIYPKIKFIPWGFLNDKLFNKVINLDYVFDKPLQKVFSDKLGLEWKEIRPRISSKDKQRPFSKNYVCIAVQSTCQSRYWNRPGGWEELIILFKKNGLEVVCLDQHKIFGAPGWFNSIPKGCIDRTGLELDEVINYINHSEFFVGLSSGLMWLAHALNKHTVIISGSTHEWCESTIDTTRIINKEVCHGCFNEPNVAKFDAGDWLWCPQNAGTDQQFICSKSIAPSDIFEKLKENNLV